ncbi:hypothetical protein [Nannocystis sp.]|nr:hypothetical protein [Nannocystis sp.]
MKLRRPERHKILGSEFAGVVAAVGEATRYVETGEKTGNVVITVV